MNVYTAPEQPTDDDFFSINTKVFLAGSIEQGKAKNWQQEMIDSLEGEDVVVFNPRRSAWNPNLSQTPDNEEFSEQVNWELGHINFSDVVFFYFQEGTMSPISLLELGLVLGQRKSCIVVCEPGFWRHGNVQITCDQYGVPVYSSLSRGAAALKEYLHG
jgi:hypothetical protein